MNPWTWLGVLFLVVGAAGAVLPLLPTTPFVLLAAGCFARSSPRMHAWLLRSELFGPVLRNWEQNRCMPRRARRISLLMMILVGGSSVAFFVPGLWLKLAGVALIATGCAVVLRIPVCECEDCT
ncbi:MAG: YbaN family protein [Gammaproteobacteria bacterium]